MFPLGSAAAEPLLTPRCERAGGRGRLRGGGAKLQVILSRCRQIYAASNFDFTIFLSGREKVGLGGRKKMSHAAPPKKTQQLSGRKTAAQLHLPPRLPPSVFGRVTVGLVLTYGPLSLSMQVCVRAYVCVCLPESEKNTAAD